MSDRSASPEGQSKVDIFCHMRFLKFGTWLQSMSYPLAHAKVCYFDVALRCEKYIVELQIPVDDLLVVGKKSNVEIAKGDLAVKEEESEDNLGSVELGS